MDAEWKTMQRVTVTVDPDLIDLIPEFLTRKHADLQTLKDAVENGDLGIIASLGHKIKGEGGSFGFDAMTEIGAGLETSGKKGDRDAARQLVSDLSDYLEKIEVIEGPPVD
jgi:HPt (histidine-containing phosphotransfer) domain-containing protein